MVSIIKKMYEIEGKNFKCEIYWIFVWIVLKKRNKCENWYKNLSNCIIKILRITFKLKCFFKKCSKCLENFTNDVKFAQNVTNIAVKISKKVTFFNVIFNKFSWKFSNFIAFLWYYEYFL